MNFRRSLRNTRSALDERTLYRPIYDRPIYDQFIYDRPIYERSIYRDLIMGRPMFNEPLYPVSTSRRVRFDESRYNGSSLDDRAFETTKFDYYKPYVRTPATDTIIQRPTQNNSTSDVASAVRSDSSGGTCPHCHQQLNVTDKPANNFETVLHKLFPGAYGLEEFVFQTKQTLVSKGFYPHVNTFVCVGLCRDEITSPFEEEVEAMWGQSFICGSLGGMLFCGKTGFAAAHHHAPDTARIVYYCFTHIAIDHDGIVGSVYRTRSGMHEKTTACGALAAFTNEIASNKLNLNFDEDDIEMSMLKKHIIDKTNLSTDANHAPDLLKVTMAAYETITIDLERHARQDARNFKDRQYALFTGVQIHGPEGSDYCWLGKASLLINGQLLPLTFAANNTSSSRS